MKKVVLGVIILLILISLVPTVLAEAQPEQTLGEGWEVKEGSESFVTPARQAEWEEKAMNTINEMKQNLDSSNLYVKDEFTRIRDEMTEIKNTVTQIKTRVDNAYIDMNEMKKDIAGMKEEINTIKKTPITESPSGSFFSIPFLILIFVNIALIALLVYDLTVLKRPKIKPSHIKQIQGFMKHHMHKGTKFEHVRNELKKVGWKDSEIMKAYHGLKH